MAEQKQQQEQRKEQQQSPQQVQHQQPPKSEMEILEEKLAELTSENEALQRSMIRNGLDVQDELALELGYVERPDPPPLSDPANMQRRQTPAVVTRVVADLMIFVKADFDAESFGLVFKPDKIKGYAGERLDTLGIHVGVTIPSIEWETDTLNEASRVVSVTINSIHHDSGAARAM